MTKSYKNNNYAKCIFCNNPSNGQFLYHTLDVCWECFLRLELKKLKNMKPPVDLYMRSLVKTEDRKYIDALNTYSTLFHKTDSAELFGIFHANLKDREMDEVFINSMILAARAILLFGEGLSNKNLLNSKKLHALHVLGNLVNVSIINQLTENYRELDLEEESNMSKLCNEIDQTFINILEDIKCHDNGSLDDLIIETINLIFTDSKYG